MKPRRLFNVTQRERRRWRRHALLAVAALLVAVPAAFAQEADTTRAEHLRQMRLEKAAHMEHPEPGFFEKVAVRVAGFVERNQLVIDVPEVDLYEIHPVLGGLRSGAGTTFGLRREWSDQMLGLYADASVMASLRRYYGAEGVMGYESGPWVGYGYSRYWHMPQEDFYGLGPNTPREQRSNFRLNEFIAGGLVGYNPLPNVLLGAHLSYQASRYGRGQDEDYPTVEQEFPQTPLPGLGADVDHIILGGYAEFDTRNIAYEKAYGSRFAPTEERLRGISLDASRGFYLTAEVIPHFHTGRGRYDFTRFDLEMQEYLPIRHGFQVLALRQFVSLTQTGPDNEVPFYMMKTLGGSRTLRGFSSFRFRDRNLLLTNSEFRWQVLRVLDMAVFLDAGHVFTETEQLSLDDLEVGYGLGFRFRTRERILARLDIARSREGFTLYIKLGTIL